jgi:dienelactone hydrolase
MIPSRLTPLALLLLFPAALPAQEKVTYPPPAEVKAAFLKLLDRPRVLFNVKMAEAKKDDDGLVWERLTFATEKKGEDDFERVPLLLVRPEKRTKKLPAVIVLHGTGGSKDGENLRPWLLHLVKRGIVAVAIDARYHGERSGGAKGAEAYNQAIVRAWQAKAGEKQEHPFYYDTCSDLWRTVDYLQTRDDIDPERIGMIGLSMGGIQTWLAAAVDERVKVVVPAIAVQSFRWSLENDKWQARANTIKAASEAAAKDLGEAKVNAKVCRELWNKIIPGILDEFDCPSMIRLFAGVGKGDKPRALLILNGDNDPNCPLEGAKLAFAQAEAAYKAKNASERLKILVAKDTPHRVTNEQRQAALDWLEKWLKE